MKKRLLSLLLCLVAVLTLLPLPALADGGHSHCICGGDVTAGDHTGHADVTYQPWNGTSGITYANGAAYVYLTGNATLSGHLTVDGKTLYLCLNGKTLASNGTAKIQVKNGGRLVLCDCRGGGTFKGATQSVWGGACIYLYTSTLDMFGGKLTGGKVTGKGGGGAIALDDQQCIFNMYGGEISGNNGKNYGGAIFRKFNANMPNTTGGTFNMYGGTIKNNTAKNGGAFFSTAGEPIKKTGGAISGKDPSKVDRSAAYATRWVAKNIVAAGLAKQCEVQVAYAIGVAKPVSIMVDTFGTGTVSDEKIEQAVEKVFDLTPAAIIRELDLRKPIYRKLSAYGHMGREDLGVKWENTDRVDALKAAVAAL